MDRLIDSGKHNHFVADGIDPHRPTNLAPMSLLQPFEKAFQERIDEKQAQFVQKLHAALGAPLFQDQGFILYCDDCLNILDRMQHAGILFDLTVTSPPYNIGKEYESTMPVEAYIEWCSAWMKKLHSITRPDGTFWLNVGYLEVADKGLCVPIPYLLWNKSPFYFLQEVVWKYGAGVSSRNRFSPRNEKWLFYVKDHGNYTFNLDAIRDPNVKYPNQKKNGKYRCNPLGKNPSDVWEYPKVTTGTQRSSKERTGHPAQFPLAIVERIIRASSNPAEIVIDPFAGSCSAGIAAAGAGRIFLGVEIREDYCQEAINRYKAFSTERAIYRNQLVLF